MGPVFVKRWQGMSIIILSVLSLIESLVLCPKKYSSPSHYFHQNYGALLIPFMSLPPSSVGSEHYTTTNLRHAILIILLLRLKLPINSTCKQIFKERLGILFEI